MLIKTHIVSCVLFMWSTQGILGQQRVEDELLLKGRITGTKTQAEGINVINVRTEIGRATDIEGNFEIPAQIGDTLLISAVYIKPKRWVVPAEKNAEGRYIINVKTQATELREVMVQQKSDFDAVSLGILQKPAVKMTVAQRRLHTATSGAGIVPLDPIINAISGRTAMLVKGVLVEEKERCIVKLEQRLPLEFYTEKLHIPKDKVKAFWYYAVESDEVRGILKGTNRTALEFVLAQQAKAFLAL